MTVAEEIYAEAQKLLALSYRCKDEKLAAAMKAVARELQEIAYRQDGVVAVGEERNGAFDI